MNSKIADYITANYNELMSINDFEQLAKHVQGAVVKLNERTMFARKFSFNVSKLNSLIKLQQYLTNITLANTGDALIRRR
jgi:hypothetical protein